MLPNTRQTRLGPKVTGSRDAHSSFDYGSLSTESRNTHNRVPINVAATAAIDASEKPKANADLKADLCWLTGNCGRCEVTPRREPRT